MLPLKLIPKIIVALLIFALGAAEVPASWRLFRGRRCHRAPACCVVPCAPPASQPQALPPEFEFPSPLDRAESATQPRHLAPHLPYLAQKPAPQSSTYQNCPPRGDATGDQDLNFLKNRIDIAPAGWIPVDLGAVLDQTYPTTVHRRHRAVWTPSDLAAVTRYEGLPISVIGYFAGARDEGTESCNCHVNDPSMFDIHTWLTQDPVVNMDRTHAVVAEVTPRLKPAHPNWTQAAIQRLAKQGTKVRVSGWLLLDQEHPEQLGKTRGTLWEIHPIMEIEVWQNGQWVPLDQQQGMAKRLVTRWDPLREATPELPLALQIRLADDFRHCGDW